MDDDAELFRPLEPAFLIKENTFEELPKNNKLLTYIPVIVLEKLSNEFFKIETIQNKYEYLCHKDLLIKVKNVSNIFTTK